MQIALPIKETVTALDIHVEQSDLNLLRFGTHLCYILGQVLYESMIKPAGGVEPAEFLRYLYYLR